MSRAVRPRVLPSWMGFESGACSTTVLVVPGLATSRPTKAMATMAPPMRAETKATSGPRLEEGIDPSVRRHNQKEIRTVLRLVGQPGQRAARGLDILGPHQRLTHEDGVHAHLVELVELVPGRVAG